MVRDSLRSIIEGVAVEAKDADIVVATAELEESLMKLGGSLSRTPLGGFRWMPEGARVPVDIWQLADTVWIRDLGLTPSIANFLAGVDLNIDRIAVGLHDHAIHDQGALAGIQTRLIKLDAEIRLDTLRYDELARAILASCQTGYAPAPEIIRLIEGATPAGIARGATRLRAEGCPEPTVAAVLSFAAKARSIVAAA